MCIAFTGCASQETPDIVLMGDKLEWVDNIKHLGNILSHNLDEGAEMKLKRSELIGRVNMMVANLPGVTDQALMKVFQAQCCSFYGSQAWLLQDQNVAKFHTLYNRCVRRLLSLPWTTHTRYLPSLSGAPLSIFRTGRMFSKMWAAMKKSDNYKVRYLANTCGAGSIIGRNVAYLENQTSECTLTQDEQCTVTAIRELKDNMLPHLFNESETLEFCNFLCTC